MFSFVLLLQSFPGLSQQTTKTFRGVVTDQKNTPLEGVTVAVKGMSRAVSTQKDGSFSIDAAEGSTLIFTSVGAAPKELVARGTGEINLQLEATASTLNDVVVVAYGTQRRRDITGSVAVVNVGEAKKLSTSDMSNLLQGRVSGVQVTSDGQPGATPNVRIRGIGTFGNSQPLYVIDGVQVGTVVRDFSPNDIESIQVLKDASAAALYGSAAANGVIIITTRQGRKNAPLKVEYNGYYGIDKVWQRVPVTDRATYQTLNNEARQNAGRTPAPANNPASPLYITNINTDWQKEGLKTGSRQNHNVAFSGGSAYNTYNFSLDYFDNKGTYVGNGPSYTRYTARVNTSYEKGILKVGENISYTHSHENYLTSTSTNDLAGAQAPLITILAQAIPTMPVYDTTKEGGFGGTLSTLQDEISLNGIGVNSLVKNYTDVDRTFANVYGELQLLKSNGHSIRYRLNLSYDKTQARDYSFKPSFDLGYFFQSPLAKLNDNSRVFTTGLVENTLTYQKSFDKHALEVLVGQTFLKSTTVNRGGYAEGFTKPYRPLLSNGATSTSTGSLFESARASYLARLNYNYNGKYLLTASMRRDASSVFSPVHRVGYFPSVSAGWRISEEAFFNVSKDVVTDLKIRGSYGKLGNDNIGLYQYLASINSGVVYTFGGVRSVGAIQTSVASEDIKWEDRTSTNIGLDAVLFKGNVDFSAEYYNNKSIDVLVNIPIPASVGSINANPVINAATLQNSGLDFSAAYHKRQGAFTFDVSANFSTLKNKVLSLGGNKEPINGAGSRTIVGSEVGQHYGYIYEGIFQTAAEVTAHATQDGAAPGDIKFKDISGPDGKADGKITPDDRTFLGSGIPKYSYGFNFSAGYKNFDFSLFASGMAKFLINGRLYRSLMHTGGSSNYHEDMLNRWTPANTNTTVPRLQVLDPNVNGRDSDRPDWLQSGDFLRINTLSLGYTIPEGTIKGISRLRVYITTQNLYTFQKYKGYNPDFTSGVFNPGYDDGSYPKPRTIMGGVQVGF
jgi:TonB-linked SusC/RagA family outer membrane protein